MTRRLGKELLLQLWLPVLIFVIVLIATAGSKSLYFPPLAHVLDIMWTGLAGGKLLPALGFSMRNLLTGLAIAAVSGVLLGLVLGEHERLRVAATPVLDFFRAMPHVAFVPVIIIALGIASAPKVFLIVFGSIWPILLNTVDGVAGIPPSVREAARSYRIPYWLRLRKVVLPGALPQIFAGLRIAVAVGIVLMVVGEMYGSAQGIGYYILTSGSDFAVAETWAGTLLLGIVGYALSMAVLGAEHLCLGWYFQRAPRARGRR